MDKSPTLDIDDQDGLIKAMNAMKPGDQIEVQGSDGTMTIGVPSLESDEQLVEPPQRRQEGGSGSWLD